MLKNPTNLENFKIMAKISEVHLYIYSTVITRKLKNRKTTLKQNFSAFDVGLKQTDLQVNF